MDELLLRGATVVDGTGASSRTSDVLVSDGRITALGQFREESAQRVVDVDGCVLAPGFIDLHTHCDFTIHHRPDAPAMVRQGVTTIVLGNCGYSSFPASGPASDLAEWAAFIGGEPELVRSTADEALDGLARLPLAPNVVQLVGHGAVRLAVMGDADRPATESELTRMKELIRRSIRTGASGMSTGLIYPPGNTATMAELVGLAGAAASAGGWHATHVRDEGPGLADAVIEAIAIGTTARVRTHISHLKAGGPEAERLIAIAMGLIGAARRAGLAISADQYPYTSSSTKLAAAIPDWARQALASTRLAVDGRDRRVVERLHGEMTDSTAPGIHRRPDRIVLVDPPGSHSRTELLTDYATRSARTPAEALVSLFLAQGDSMQMIVQDRVSEEALRNVLQDGDVAVASDGWALDGRPGANPHPRSFGSFVRVLGRYVRDERVLSMEAAIRKMTAVPAELLGASDRGVIRVGAVADLVVFDPATVDETASLDAPFGYARGVHHVLVGGEFVVEDGEPTARRPGRVLRRMQVAA